MRFALVLALAVLVPARALAQQRQVEFYHLDAVGSVRAVTNQQGQVVSRHDFLPFGEEWTPSTPQRENKLFSGQVHDADTSLDYFGARYYDQRIGRFTTVDPDLRIQEALLDPQQWNRYGYVSNNPLRYVDPNGRWGIDVHFYLTYFLAGASGHSDERANRIATANVGVDIARNPFRIPAEARSQWHFPNTMRTVEVMEAMANGADDATFGEALHVYQDSSSHFGFAPWKGHAAESLLALADPDSTSRNIDKAMGMARDSYNLMLNRSDRELEAIPWSKVAPYVRRYLEAGSEKEKDRRFYEMRQFLLRGQQ